MCIRDSVGPALGQFIALNTKEIERLGTVLIPCRVLVCADKVIDQMVGNQRNGRQRDHVTLPRCILFVEQTPVSYTHLDVYKRQVVRAMNWPSAGPTALRSWKKRSAIGNSVARRGTPAEGRLKALIVGSIALGFF